MAKMKAKCLTPQDFSRKQIYQIAKAYSTGTYSYHDFIEEYGSTQTTFYTLIGWAITKCIVPQEMVEAIDYVAVSNSSNKALDEYSNQSFAAEVAIRGRKCNQVRRLKRYVYVLPRKEAISMIEEYLLSHLSKQDFCAKQFYITVRCFQKTLKKAIIQSWISLKKVEELRHKAYVHNNHKDVDALFDELISERKRYSMSKK